MNSVSWLDFKTGYRMVVRYPGLTLVATLAMAMAMALATIYFEGVDKVLHPRLPIRDAGRVISIQNWDQAAAEPEGRALYDFAIWREQVRTVPDLGAAIPFVRNLATEDGRVEPVRGAEVTASAFRLMEVPPLLGRSLEDLDEQPSAAPVVVIGYTVWKTRLALDPAVLGRTVKVGTATARIVGVMPEGFGFPVSQSLWTPLRADESVLGPRTGPAVSVFGRLAPGASMESAQAELEGIAARIAAASPATHATLRPRITAYGAPPGGGEALVLTRILYAVNGIFVLLLAVICANVATLVFARTASRGWELAVRNALGASRGRIVAQLFVEALVLASIAAVVGLLMARVGLHWAISLLRNDAMPFWIDDRLSWTTVPYAALMTLVAAAVVGILPALRITRVNVLNALRNESAAGAGLRFGGFWTTVIVLQVALTVAFMPIAGGGIFESNRFRQRAEAIGAERYITASVDMDREDYETDSSAFAARARRSFDELERRLGAEPGVEQVAFADRLPVMDQFKYRIEVDAASAAPADGLRTSTLVHVSRGFFAAFGTSVVAGRDFLPLDFQADHVLIVNESFAHYVFGDRSPIGQRVRVVGGEDDSVAGDQWYEIVGMVEDFGWQLPVPPEQSAMYRPRLPEPGARVSLAVRVRDPDAFALRLRALTADVDPAIRLTDVQASSQAVEWLPWSAADRCAKSSCC